jgi:hypothetical protein
LEAFYSSFRGSEEERSEVLKYYQRFKGDMHKVLGWRVSASRPGWSA